MTKIYTNKYFSLEQWSLFINSSTDKAQKIVGLSTNDELSKSEKILTLQIIARLEEAEVEKLRLLPALSHKIGFPYQAMFEHPKEGFFTNGAIFAQDDLASNEPQSITVQNVWNWDWIVRDCDGSRLADVSSFSFDPRILPVLSKLKIPPTYKKVATFDNFSAYRPKGFGIKQG